ncbi:DNA alkylation repair protein [Candidatus Woesearchaeota archaeon]|nr:DNA alkylation repair protein [Candidatus Woesearchaeota archaeon]
MSYEKIVNELEDQSDEERKHSSKWFFKTGPGEYGEGDVFIGLTMPQIRKTAKKYKETGFEDVKKLISNKVHEYRMTGYLILTYKYEKADDDLRREIYEFYIKNRNGLNNWDLIDVTTPKIVGLFLLDKDRSILYEFAKSNDLWEKRIAVLSTFTFIKNGEFEDAIKISEILLKDSHDLIHKAVGWMLREIGKKDEKRLTNFLDKYATKMPRTMLRYSIEKFEENKRLYYLKKK